MAEVRKTQEQFSAKLKNQNTSVSRYQTTLYFASAR
jgi:hypothetical protein